MKTLIIRSIISLSLLTLTLHQAMGESCSLDLQTSDGLHSNFPHPEEYRDSTFKAVNELLTKKGYTLFYNPDEVTSDYRLEIHWNLDSFSDIYISIKHFSRDQDQYSSITELEKEEQIQINDSGNLLGEEGRTFRIQKAMDLLKSLVDEHILPCEEV